SIMLLGMAALAGGCATPNLERIATVQSRAEALYAYGGVATFPISSELVEVSIYAPVHHEREYQPIPIEREKAKPVVNKLPTNPAVSDPTKPVVDGPPTKPAINETPIKPGVSKPAQSADAGIQQQAASTKLQQSTAQTKDITLESAEPAEVQKVTAVT